MYIEQNKNMIYVPTHHKSSSRYQYTSHLISTSLPYFIWYCYLCLVFYGHLQVSSSSNLHQSNVDQNYSRWDAKGDKNLRLYKSKDVVGINSPTDDSILINIYSDHRTVEVTVNMKQVLRLYNVSVKVDENTRAPAHRGIHLVALHHSTGEVMYIKQFHTWQPRAAEGLLKAFKSFQPGRLLVIVAPGDWRQYMTAMADSFLYDTLQSQFPEEICNGETWATVVTLGGRHWAEAATIYRNYSFGNGYSTPPLQIKVSVPKMHPSLSEERCNWERAGDNKMAEYKSFCNKYEGYSTFCNCNCAEFISPLNAPPQKMREIIPVAIVTSRRQHNVVRLLRQLWSQPGGANTPILFSVDGAQKEALDLARLLDVPAVFHNNLVPPGSAIRINNHIKFTLYQAFLHFSDADKIIILEDDLLLSPDFLGYFQQIAPLLDKDESIFCANAFSYNTFVPSAHDATRLTRVRMYPAYGWMITRKRAYEIIAQWPAVTDVADWDWWIRHMILVGRTTIVPEVSRTFHDGYGGVHTTGWEQYYYFDRRPLNSDPYVKLNLADLTEPKFEERLIHALDKATVLRITDHPCRRSYVPKWKVGTFLINYYLEDDSDEHKNYYIIHSCFGGYGVGRMENYNMVHSLGYYGNVIYTVGCPASKYCRLTTKKYNEKIYRGTEEDIKITREYMNKILHKNLTRSIKARIEPEDSEEEFEMTNYVQYDA